MEVYILSRENLSILSVTKLSDYQINLDEETNAKSTFTLVTTDGLEKDNFLVINGLYRQFLFIIDEVQSEKDSIISTVTCLDISNIFDRKVIEENTDEMTTDSIELFLANTISNNFVNSDDQYLNINYIDIYVHTSTQGIVSTNAENGLYNFHTFMTNCRQNKNVYTDFKFENGKLRIDISYKNQTTQMIDTTLPEVINYNKIKEEDITAKVTVLIREDGSIYNLYLKTDRTTTTDKDDPDRASGKIEVISVDTADKAPEEALNVMRGNRYKHLVEFQIAKTSKLMDITQLTIGRPVLIKTNEDIYESYISAITLTDENFVYFKSGSLRDTFIDKLKSTQNDYGNKIDVTSVVDSLNSNNPYAPLSAKQGKELKDMFDNYMPETITAYINRKSFTQYQSWVSINLAPFDTYLSNTNKITVTNSGLKIGAGVSKILISAHSRGINHSAFSGDKVFLIRQNNESVATAPIESYMTNQGSWCSQTISPALVSCQENDVFSLYLGGGGTGTGELLGEWLTIQIIE